MNLRRLLGLASALLLGSCAGVVTPSLTVPPLEGRLQVPTAAAGFQTAMAAADLVSNATVSLVDFAGSNTLASVTTDSQGHFTVPAPGVAANTAFYAVASKRPTPLGQRLNLRTLVLWDGAAWQSVTRLNSANAHVINPTTTAVTLLHAATPAKATLPGEILGVVAPGGSNLYDQVALWAGGADAPASGTAVQFANHMVTNLLPHDQDPLSALTMVTDVTATGRSSVAAATAGETDVTIQGYGFDPQPAQNVVSFSANGRTVLATPLPTSTATQLQVRVPDYLPVSTTGVPVTTTILVSNRSGVPSVPVAGWMGLLVHGPQVVSDDAAVLPDVTLTLGIGSATGAYDAVAKRNYAVWVDQRFYATNTGKDSIVIRSGTELGGFDAGAQRVSTDIGDGTAGHLDQEAGRLPYVVADEVNGRAHVFWDAASWSLAPSPRTRAVFHRIYMPGVTPAWSTGSSNPAGDCRNVADIGAAGTGGTGQRAYEPAAAADGSKIMVAYKQDMTPPNPGDIQVRLWNGTSMASGNLGRADWSNGGTANAPTNVSSSLYDSRYPNLAVGGPAGGWRYHVAWWDLTSAANQQLNFGTGGAIRYARLKDNSGTLSVQPAPVATTGAPSALELSSEANPISPNRPAIAADAVGNVLVAWRGSDALYWRHLTYNAAAPVADASAAQVPGSAATASHGSESNPTLAHGAGTDEFYMVSQTVDPLPVGDGMELWVRRYASGTWSTRRIVRPSTAISSEQPWLMPRGNDLALLWFEGRKLLNLPLIWPLDGV